MNPFDSAIRDCYLNKKEEPLILRDGEKILHHPVEQLYFETFDPTAGRGGWLDSLVEGPLLDLGARAGKRALYFQEQFETVVANRSWDRVQTMRDRGIHDVRNLSILELSEKFEKNKFRCVIALGKQTGVLQSVSCLQLFLDELAFVTEPDAIAVLDSCDPEAEHTTRLLGYRPAPTSGIGSRVLHFEYDGNIGEPKLMFLFSPDRLREATEGTQWTVSEIRRDADHPFQYVAVLIKDDPRQQSCNEESTFDKNSITMPRVRFDSDVLDIV